MQPKAFCDGESTLLGVPPLKVLVFDCVRVFLKFLYNLHTSEVAKSFSRGKAHPSKSATPPGLQAGKGKLLTNVERVQVGQARGGLLQQGDGLQAEVGKVLLLHVL